MAYIPDKSFWLRLQISISIYVDKEGCACDDSYFCEDNLKRAYYCLDGRYRKILLMRIGERKTQAEVSNDLNISQQRVSILERRAYSLICKHLANEQKPLTWDEKPLIDGSCCDDRNIENVLKLLTPRIVQSLKMNNYETMQQLCAATPRRLMEIRGMGFVSVKKIESSLIAYRQRNPQFFQTTNKPKVNHKSLA